MFLKKSTSTKNGRTYLSIVQGYRDKATGTSRTRTVKSLGYLDELEAQYEDPVAYFTKVAAEMDHQRLEQEVPLTFSFDPLEVLQPSSFQSRKNMGYIAFNRIYHELQLDRFFDNRQRHMKLDYSINEVTKLLVFGRLLVPASKKKTFEMKDRFFGKHDFSLDDVYRCLTHLNKHKDALQLWLHEHVLKQYNRNLAHVYYDVTNYYFEIDEPDRLRKKGVSKEHRPNPIVQMGLLMDSNGLPMAYKLFPGNTNDCLTLRPVLQQVTEQFGLGRIIVVADKGLNTSDNICLNILDGNGYVYSQSIRGANRELKDYVLNENGYTWLGTDYKRKSRLYPREITVTNIHGKKVKSTVDEKQVIFYSRDYDIRAKAERSAALAKAYELVNMPGKFNQATSYGAAKYIKDLVFDKKTGEIITAGHHPSIDLAKLEDDERYDGYYAIVTSEYKESDERIIDIYRGLWEIEESFRITKSDLSARPVFVSREDHIEAHFLTCFLALLLMRILELRTDHKYSPANIIENLCQVNATYLKDNYYMFDYFNDTVKDIGDAVGIDFSRRFLRLSDMKKFLAATKKS